MSHSSRFFSLFCALVILGLALGLGACGDSETGQVRVHVADAPFPFGLLDSAVVAIHGVEVHVASGPGDDSGFETISTEEDTVNLLDLQNGVTRILGEADVPVGYINQVRLLVVDAWVVLTDGRNFPLEIPSGDRSGIKIHVEPPIEVQGGLTSELLLDFDVSRSFHPTPASPINASDIVEFVFRPSVRAVNLSEAGSVSGRVLDDLGTPDTDDDVPIEGATVAAYRGNEELTTTATDENGDFVLIGLPAGEITITANATSFGEEVIDVTVVAGNLLEDNILRLHRTDP